MRIRPLLVALTTSAALSAAAALPAPYTQTPTAKEYPGADVLVLSEVREYTLSPDGRVTEKVQRVEKILTYQGMDAVGDPKVSFHKSNQILKDAYLKTFTAEGEVKEAKANSFTEMTPHELGLAPDYTGWRQMVMSKVGLDLGAVVESGWTLEDTRAWRSYLNLQVPLAEGHPSLLRRIVVRVPAGTTLASATPFVSPSELKWEKGAQEGGFEVQSWTLAKSPALAVGELGAHDAFLLPRLVVTTCPDWKGANATYASYAQKAIEATSPALAAKAKNLVEGKSTPLQKAEALTEFVATHIQSVEWPLAAFDYRPRPAARTFTSGYGHSLDKAVLLCAMLREVGIQAAPALGTFAPLPEADPEKVPCVAQFDGVILHAKLGEQTLWLSPEAPLKERSHAQFQGFAGMPLLAGYGEIHRMTPVGPEDLWAFEGEAELEGTSGFKGNATLRMVGAYSPYYEVQGSGESLKEYLRGVLRSILPGAKLTAHDVSALSPSEVTAKIEFELAGEKDAAIPALKTGLPGASALAHLSGLHRNRRDFTLLLPPAGKESVRLSFKLPEGKVPSYMPPSIEKSCEGVAARQTWTLSEGRLRWEWSAELSTRVVPPAQYPAFRSLVTSLQSEAARSVLF